MRTERCRPVNFFLPPFSSPAPICLGLDTMEAENHEPSKTYVILLSLQDLVL